jgi:hypothetical protein
MLPEAYGLAARFGGAKLCAAVKPAFFTVKTGTSPAEYCANSYQIDS